MARWMMQRRIFYRYCIMSSYLKFLSRNKLYTAIEAVGLSVRPSVSQYGFRSHHLLLLFSHSIDLSEKKLYLCN